MDEKKRLRLLPVNMLSEDEKDLKNYLKHPIGNSPEMMPWDCSLNKDIKDAIMRHVCYMCHLSENDICKFSLSTPVVAPGPSTISCWSTKMGPQPASKFSRIL
jgi:hypothetical protein